MHREGEEVQGGAGLRHAQPQGEEGDQGDDKPARGWLQLRQDGPVPGGEGGAAPLLNT